MNTIYEDIFNENGGFDGAANFKMYSLIGEFEQVEFVRKDEYKVEDVI